MKNLEPSKKAEYEKEVIDPNINGIFYESQSNTNFSNKNLNKILKTSGRMERTSSIRHNEEFLLDNSILPNKNYMLEDQMEIIHDFNVLNNKVSNALNINNLLDLEGEMDDTLKDRDSCVNLTADAQSILQDLLGKKSYRDPNEYAKTLTKKHTLGDINCEDVILDNDKYDKDIEMVMKYAESAHPFKVVIEFCQKFKWSTPEIETYNIGTNESPQFKTTISIKNNTFKGEAVGVQKNYPKVI